MDPWWTGLAHAYTQCLILASCLYVEVGLWPTILSLVYNISSPFRHNRKPLIFQWVLTLGNAGIGSVSIPAFRSVNAH